MIGSAMIRSHIHILVPVFFLFSGLVACEKDDPSEAPGTNGILEGTVIPYDEFGHPLYDAEDIQVEMLPSGRSALTDQEGGYTFDKLEEGNYDLIFSKEGYADTKELAYYIRGDGKQYLATRLSQPSTTVVSDIQMLVADNGDVDFSGRLTPQPTPEEPRKLVLYFHSGSNITHQRYIYTIFVTIEASMLDESGRFSHPLSGNYFKGEFKFDNLTTYFVRVYGISYYDEGYFNRGTGLTIYNTVSDANSSEVISVELN